MRIDEEILRAFAEAYGKLIDAEIEEAIAEAEKHPHVFSEEFEKRMEELIRTGRSPREKRDLKKR